MSDERKDTFEPGIGEKWSQPIQAKIEYPMDCFKMVRCVPGCRFMDGYEEPSIIIRHEGDGQIYININPYEHVSHMKSITMPFKEFVEKMGEAFFGPNWKEAKY